jgi:hypothetical protein
MKARTSPDGLGEATITDWTIFGQNLGFVNESGCYDDLIVQLRERKRLWQSLDCGEIEIGHHKVSLPLNLLQKFFETKGDSSLSTDVEKLSQNNSRDQDKAFAFLRKIENPRRVRSQTNVIREIPSQRMSICYIHGVVLVCFTLQKKGSFCRGKVLLVNGNPLPNTPKRTRVFFGQIGTMELQKGSTQLGKFVSYTGQSFTDRGFRGVFHGLISWLSSLQGTLDAPSRKFSLETIALQLKGTVCLNA